LSSVLPQDRRSQTSFFYFYKKQPTERRSLGRMAQSLAQTKAQNIATKLRNGNDCEDDVKDFLTMGSSVPDGLVVAALGFRHAGQEAGPSPKALRSLLEGKGDPNAKDPQTEGPAMHSACWHGNVEVVKILLEFKANIEAEEPRMKTPPLNTALAAGNAAVCLELLNRNCDVSWKHHDGATPLHVATAWIASSHNSNLRMPPIGEEPRAVIAMMMHNGVDPTHTEGMSKGANRSTGMTPLETFRREIARSPWRTHAEIGAKFDKNARVIHVLLEQGESAVKDKDTGNKAFKEKRYEDAIKAWKEARETWEKADVRGHHTAVLWNNEALCRRQMDDAKGSKNACEQGLTHYSSAAIRTKLEHNLKEAEAWTPPPEPTPQEVEKKEEELEARKEKAIKKKEEIKVISKKAIVEAPGTIYGEEGSSQKDYVMPPTFICPMDQAQDMGIGPPKTKTWWEKRDADSDEEERHPESVVYLPAHHPKW